MPDPPSLAPQPVDLDELLEESVRVIEPKAQERNIGVQPEVEVVMVTAYGSVGGAVDAMQEGAFHYLEKPVDLDELDEVVQRALERHHRVSENSELKTQLREHAHFEGIIAADAVMEEALNIAARAAPSRVTVLVTGESGTGKELVAQAIHAASPRRTGPFVAVNCAALNENLMESELFGHEKGAFTGADKMRIGRFEQADGGTLFIDEVGEIPVGAQVKLLRCRNGHLNAWEETSRSRWTCA